MNNGDKILAVINADCDNEIKKIFAECDSTISNILEQAKQQGQASYDEIVSKSRKKAEQMKINSKNHAELEVRNSLLQRRREEIEHTFKDILAYLSALDTESYFNIIFKLLSQLNSKEGILLFNERDLNRLPNDFTARLKENGFTLDIDSKPVDISGGFILKNGYIEENMSFSAILEEKRDKLEDFINRQLFCAD